MSRSTRHIWHPHLPNAFGITAWATLILSAFVGIYAYTTEILPSKQFAAVITSSLVSETNQERESEGLRDVTSNPVLVAAAQAKANDMAAKGYFAHTSPDGTSSWQWFKNSGYAFAFAGENLAVNFTDSSDVTTAWMNSPTHRANIMNGKFTEVGIATATGMYKGKETIFVVQMFGTPAVATVASQPKPQPADPRTVAALPVRTNEESVLGAEAEVLPETAGVPAMKPARTASPSPTVTQPSPAAAASTPNAIAIEPTETSAGVSPTTALAAPLVDAATSPNTVLRLIYLAAAAVLALLVVRAAARDLKLHHTRHMVAMLALFVLMGSLLTLADAVLFTPPIIGEAPLANPTSVATVNG